MENTIMGKLTKNHFINAFNLTSTKGNKIAIPQKNAVVHLQFRRFSGCPICNLHMSEMKNRQKEIEAAGILEVIVFYSDTTDIEKTLADMPFALVSDKKRTWYEKFGVEKSIMSIASPLVIFPGLVGFFKHIRKAAHYMPKSGESMIGLPAEFLIDTQGKIIDLKYGTHAYDQWTVEELLTKVKPTN